MAGITRLVFDTETDGVDPLRDHIVSATLLGMDDSGQIVGELSWLLNFGGTIPQGAIDVHGISNEKMRAEGRTDIGNAIGEILAIIWKECVHGSATLVAYNASFDLTLLETERLRHCPHLMGLSIDRLNIFDPLVVWKHIVPKKRGKRKLADAAESFKVAVDETQLHDARYDCILAGRVAIEMRKRAKLRGLTDDQITLAQIGWKREQAASLQAWFRENGKPNEVVIPDWPMYHRTAVAA